jgi:hypothetical protein
MMFKGNPRRRLDIQLLWTIGLLLVSFRVVTVVCWGNNYLWPDEIYQSLEQAHRAVFGYGIVPWEFRDAVRSWVFPGALAGLMAAGSPLGHDGYLLVPRMALSLLSISPAIVVFLWVRRRTGRLAGFVAALSVGVWFEVVYFAPKALAEVAASHILIVGLYLMLEHQGARPRSRSYWAGGLLCLAVLLRLQLSIGIGAAFLLQVAMDWKSRMRHAGRALRMLAGASPVLLLFGVVDWITWRYPFQSLWNYFSVNILSGKAATYGVLPFGAYFQYLVDVWGAALIPIVLLAILGARGRLPLVIAALATLLLHSTIAHKEYRFDYPVVVLILVLAATGTADLVNEGRLSRFQKSVRAAVPWVALAGWATVSLLLALRFDMGLIQTPLEINRKGSPWTVRQGAMSGMRELGTSPTVCGVGVVNTGWAWVGGYTWLHRNVPLYEIWHWWELHQLARFINVVIVRGPVLDFRPYRLERCWEEYCIYRRPGGCESPPPGYSINNVLISRKQ